MPPSSKQRCGVVRLSEIGGPINPHFMVSVEAALFISAINKGRSPVDPWPLVSGLLPSGTTIPAFKKAVLDENSLDDAILAAAKMLRLGRIAGDARRGMEYFVRGIYYERSMECNRIAKEARSEIERLKTLSGH
jgi:hypothetical protein